MKGIQSKRKFYQRLLCLLLCVTVITSGIQFPSRVVHAATIETKFVHAEPEVFAPQAGEQTKLTFNFESKRTVNIYVKDGKKVIANLVTNKEYEGNYVTHEFLWDGKDDNGNYVNSGTYK